ncbi:hypothetical protein [Immundisolibacter cernigliae]|uniref:PepSY domain-containing protein n=1 Tax=Immundisolibacter cernigliae TaxID=1810504 RepID=A0A1B1YPR1_9GAMM|nr:hypothetical protein [Immundisolibacter cernigliae]ANX02739.1 hypothetical protein PG2T_00025 [Immundisolibacter cernigliae]
MKRTRHGLRLAICLLILAVSGPVFADRALGGSDDRRGYQRDDDRRGSYQSNDRRREYGSSDRGSSRSRSGERTRAEDRPLGTSYDDHRGRSRDDQWERQDDRYRNPDQRNRHGNDARRAADAVRRDERGRVLSSEPTDDRGYRVRVLTPDGYVRERYVDPRDDRQR